MSKSIIPWIGGKSALMWAINVFRPPDFHTFIDVFGGSATVTLNLEHPASCLRIYNDFNGNLVNLFRCARDQPASLIHELNLLPFNSRDEFEMLKMAAKGDDFTADGLKKDIKLCDQTLPPPQAEEIRDILTRRINNTDIRRAATFYKLLRYSFSSGGKTYGVKTCNIRRLMNDIWQFSHDFEGVVIERKSFADLIPERDGEGVFTYADPPYYGTEGMYAVMFPQEHHRLLHDLLSGCRSHVMVSYNFCDFICTLYDDFYIVKVIRPNSLARKAGSQYEEVLMFNYDPMPLYQQRTRQTNLFGDYQPDTHPKFEVIHRPVAA